MKIPKEYSESVYRSLLKTRILGRSIFFSKRWDYSYMYVPLGCVIVGVFAMSHVYIVRDRVQETDTLMFYSLIRELSVSGKVILHKIWTHAHQKGAPFCHMEMCWTALGWALPVIRLKNKFCCKKTTSILLDTTLFLIVKYIPIFWCWRSQVLRHWVLFEEIGQSCHEICTWPQNLLHLVKK